MDNFKRDIKIIWNNRWYSFLNSHIKKFILIIQLKLDKLIWDRNREFIRFFESHKI